MVFDKYLWFYNVPWSSGKPLKCQTKFLWILVDNFLHKIWTIPSRFSFWNPFSWFFKESFWKEIKKKFKSLNQAQQYKKKSAKSLGLESFDNLLPLFILSGFCLEKGKTYLKQSLLLDLIHSTLNNSHSNNLVLYKTP